VQGCDALGISGHNDPKAVAEFLESYGVHPQQIIELPLPDRAKHKLAGNPRRGLLSYEPLNRHS